MLLQALQSPRQLPAARSYPAQTSAEEAEALPPTHVWGLTLLFYNGISLLFSFAISY